MQRSLLILGILLISLNLRPALASVGPLVESIRAAAGLSNTALGLLTTLPLLAFGVVSALTPLVTRRLGTEGALAAALSLIAAGALARVAPSTALLFGGTVVFGVGIALGNVLLPSLVKRDFPEHSGVMTSLYSSGIGIGAAVGAGATVPLAGTLGWRGALAAWAVPAAVALLVWLPQLRRDAPARAAYSVSASLRALGRSALAWQVALFMGFQSLTFYVALAWLPAFLQTRGFDPAAAGGLLALSQVMGVVGSAIVPAWAARQADQRRTICLLALMEGIALAGLAWPGTPMATVWVSVLGVVLGGTFGLALLLLVLRAADAETATELSGMAQSVGYLVAAAGPAVFGFLHDLTGGWAAPLVLLVLALAAKTAVGLRAGRPSQIHPDRQPRTNADRAS
ncbi:MFS transporter [Salinibacter altiplanensis]|uniref:MFS transporter n=1 Tax=Salinibacter altiplanensis TaxID=1803181 RepID=UPI000C9FD82E|nr:MFS transporter [Salinibacter altiplanensis]